MINCDVMWWAQTWLAVIVSQKRYTCDITSSLLQHVLKNSSSITNASAWTLTPLANSMFNNSMTQSSSLAVDASFQFVNVRDLGTIDSLLKHTPHGVVNHVEVQWVRRPESGWDKIRRLLIQQRYCVFGPMWWGTVKKIRHFVNNS